MRPTKRKREGRGGVPPWMSKERRKGEICPGRNLNSGRGRVGGGSPKGKELTPVGQEREEEKKRSSQLLP